MKVGFKIIVTLVLSLTVAMVSTSVAGAAKPEKASVTITGFSSPNQINVNFQWDKLGVYSYRIIGHKIDSSGGVLIDFYYLGLTDFGRRTATHSGSASIDTGEYDIKQGDTYRIELQLWGKNGRFLGIWKDIKTAY